MIKIALLAIFLSPAVASPKPQFVTIPPSNHYTKLSSDEVNHLLNRGFGPTVRSVASTLGDHEAEETAATQQRPSYAVPNAYRFAEEEEPLPPLRAKVVPAARPTKNYPQQFRVQLAKESQREGLIKEKEEEEEIEEPDRLTQLLPQSKFACNGKNTGYYADEGLGCEVFHYCQDNAKHSWICPQGFTFHQVHLICMPPGGDNICETSSQFHFVNEYLYKPVNLEEVQRKPNTSVRYSERYYPETYYEREKEEDEDDEGNRRQPVNQHRHSVRVNQNQYNQQQQQQVEVPRPLLLNNQLSRTTFRPETTLGQVFRSPNEVNIPLQQRRPQYQRYLENSD